MQWDVTEDVKSPGRHNPRKVLPPKPNEAGHNSPHDETMGYVVGSVHVWWEFSRNGAAQFRNHERTERNYIRRHAQKQRSSPLPVASATEKRAAPKSVC